MDPYCKEVNIWLLSTNFAIAFLLIWLVLGVLVVTKWSEKADFNKITLLPYYSAICYASLATLEFIGTSMWCDKNSRI